MNQLTLGDIIAIESTEYEWFTPYVNDRRQFTSPIVRARIEPLVLVDVSGDGDLLEKK
jgi:hypothetical protein